MRRATHDNEEQRLGAPLTTHLSQPFRKTFPRQQCEACHLPTARKVAAPQCRWPQGRCLSTTHTCSGPSALCLLNPHQMSAAQENAHIHGTTHTEGTPRSVKHNTTHRKGRYNSRSHTLYVFTTVTINFTSLPLTPRRIASLMAVFRRWAILLKATARTTTCSAAQPHRSVHARCARTCAHHNKARNAAQHAHARPLSPRIE